MKQKLKNLLKKYYYRDSRKVFITNIIILIFFGLIVVWLYAFQHQCTDWYFMQCPCLEKINDTWQYKNTNIDFSIFNITGPNITDLNRVIYGENGT